MKTSSYEESFDDSCKDDNIINEKSYEQAIQEYESYEHNVAAQCDSYYTNKESYEINEVQYEIEETVPVTTKNEQIATTVTQQEVYTVSAPPPVPKRTLLPADPNKTTKITPIQEMKEPLSQYVTPAATVATSPQNESLIEDAETQHISYRDIELVSPEDSAPKGEPHAEMWSDSISVSLPQIEDVETVSSDPGNAQCDPVSEMYYTASSEVSLLSDMDQDKVHIDEEDKEIGKDDRKNVISGHVAAMRERFESMTRANTPCPDLARSLSPSLEVFRNISPSPDRMA